MLADPKHMKIPSYQMSFSGEVLERGFWLYVWKIECESQLYFYVGRTGDSSSPYAASPFKRIGQHLDFRPNAKGNALARHLCRIGIEPSNSNFTMLALGPFFEEQTDFEKHKPLRDILSTLEVEAAEELRLRGHVVLGVHHRASDVPSEIVSNVRKMVSDFGVQPANNRMQ